MTAVINFNVEEMQSWNLKVGDIVEIKLKKVKDGIHKHKNNK